jgi:hypothetical protein
VRRSCWKDTRQGRKEMKRKLCTVDLYRKGFPVFFLCPACEGIHSYPEEIVDASFQDPGEALNRFVIDFATLGPWECVSEETLLREALFGR